MLFQHHWTSATVMEGVWKCPKTGFKLFCAGWSFSHEGMETPQWAPGVLRACSVLGPRDGSTAGKLGSGAGSTAGSSMFLLLFWPPLVTQGDPQGDSPQLLPRVSWCQLGSCRELEVILPLLSPQPANHSCGLFWDPFHCCNSLGCAGREGQISPLAKEILMAWLSPGLLRTSSRFSSCSRWSRRKAFCSVLFCFISLPAPAHGQIASQLPTAPAPSTSPHNGHKPGGGPDPHESSVSYRGSPSSAPKHVLCLLQGGGTAGLLAQMHGRNSF